MLGESLKQIIWKHLQHTVVVPAALSSSLASLPMIAEVSRWNSDMCNRCVIMPLMYKNPIYLANNPLLNLLYGMQHTHDLTRVQGMYV